MKHELPPLPYVYDALEPHIDKLTMQIHHDKHHQAYITKLNDALKDYPDLQEKSVEEILKMIDKIPEKIRTTAKNNAGGHFNHSLFWKIMKPGSEKKPVGKLAEAIAKKFGDFEKFKEKFSGVSANFFGSGWCWLVLNAERQLEIIALPNHDCPISLGQTPVLVLDLWEHAYYLKYQNRRAEYIAAWWNVVNWEEAENLYVRGI